MLAESDASAARSSMTGSAALSSTAILARLVADASDALDDDREAARSLLLRATLLLRSSDWPSNYLEVRRPSGPILAPWQMRRVIAHIEANLDNSLPLRELAAIAGLSTSHFSRAFKGASGQTPHAFILSRRLARARREMLEGVEPLAQIALACGFADQAHLARVFRRSAGLTPAAWRRVNRSTTSNGVCVAMTASRDGRPEDCATISMKARRSDGPGSEISP